MYLVDWCFSLLGYKKNKVEPAQQQEDSRNMQVQRQREIVISTWGQLNARVVCDGEGNWSLIGGFCIELDDEDVLHKNIFPISANRWNGKVDVDFRGDGSMKIFPLTKLDENEYTFVGDISTLDFVPYRTETEGLKTKKEYQRQVELATMGWSNLNILKFS
jgi:hypothetical protein